MTSSGERTGRRLTRTELGRFLLDTDGERAWLGSPDNPVPAS
ncbi:hypothetical protein OG875_17650 [Streptomyces sp. NBC_01498]|nr:hypothetical protein [Streptomyces sp. NBC_01498]WTL26249.1 hypothetical protein OG875_17650 [Streptomyces sp. NBC_01498]